MARDHHTARKRVAQTVANATDKARLLNEIASTGWARDLLRARWDIEFFAERFLGIKCHPGQLRLFQAVLMRDSTGWEARYLTICAVAGNRAGKTLAISIVMLHSTIFKIGMEPPDPNNPHAVERWATAAYEWYHFAIAQETSELAFIEITRILQGTHEAQKHGCPLTKSLGKEVARWDQKYRSEYLWVQLHPILGGGNIHFRTTGEKAIGSLGKDMNGISYDEAGFDPNFDFVVNEVLNMRRLSTGGQMILIGTATEGITAFADKWAEGDPDAPDQKQDSYSIRMSTRENVGFGITQKQLDRMIAQYPPELVPQNIDGYFIEGTKAFFSAAAVDRMFVEDLPVLCPALSGHRYVNGVDPAISNDSTFSIVLDTTVKGTGIGVRITHSTGRQTGPVIAAVATDSHNAYRTRETYIETGIDATGFGGKMFRDLLAITPLRSVEFGGTRGKKLQLLNDLKQMIEIGALRFPRKGDWLILRRQLLAYRLDDKGLATDAVMALAVAVNCLKRTPAGSVKVMPFDFFQTQGSTNPRVGVVASDRGPRTASFASLSSLFTGEGKTP